MSSLSTHSRSSSSRRPIRKARLKLKPYAYVGGVKVRSRAPRANGQHNNRRKNIPLSTLTACHRCLKTGQSLIPCRSCSVLFCRDCLSIPLRGKVIWKDNGCPFCAGVCDCASCLQEHGEYIVERVVDSRIVAKVTSGKKRVNICIAVRSLLINHRM